jgi:hypothetical protein
LQAFGSAVLYSHLLFKSIKTETQRTIVFPVVSYGCETCSLILWLMASENKVLGSIFEANREEIKENGGTANEKLI